MKKFLSKIKDKMAAEDFDDEAGEEYVELDTNESSGMGKITVRPFWDKVTPGYNYGCLVLDVSRKEQDFRAAIPIKLNKF